MDEKDDELAQQQKPWVDTWGFISEEAMEERRLRVEYRLSIMESLSGVERQVWLLRWDPIEAPNPRRSAKEVSEQLGITQQEVLSVEQAIFRKMRGPTKA